jgi:hypothetical protein
MAKLIIWPDNGKMQRNNPKIHNLVGETARK